MIRIRPEQLEVFNETADAAFARDLAEYIRNEHGGETVRLPDGPTAVGQIPPESLREMVRGGMERARSYGIDQESSIYAFVALMFVAAPNFDEHPLIRRVLRDEGVAPNLRIDALWGRTSDENWAALEQTYDVNAWRLPRVEKPREEKPQDE